MNEEPLSALAAGLGAAFFQGWHLLSRQSVIF